LLAYVTKGDDVQVLGSLSVLATLLQTKGCISTHTHTLNCFILFCLLSKVRSSELDESMLDGLGILPQRKQHKKLLLVCPFLLYEHLAAAICLPLFYTINVVKIGDKDTIFVVTVFS